MTQPKRRMYLTAEHVAKVNREEADEGPRPHLQQLNDADYAELAAELASQRQEDPLRIFAYGSLIWKPELEFSKGAVATLSGWHRSFCLHIERWRGTRATPGLMMALDRGGSCRGVLYELPEENPRAQMERLLRREMTNKPPTNMPRWLTVYPCRRKIPRHRLHRQPHLSQLPGWAPCRRSCEGSSPRSGPLGQRSGISFQHGFPP